jgi:hypothetical protein
MPARSAKKQRPVKTSNREAFFTQAEADAAHAQEHSQGNPRVVTQAFVEGGEPLTVAGYTIPIIGLGRYMLIERIQSPVLKSEGWKGMNNQQLAELIFVTLNSEKLTRELLAKGGRAFDDAVALFSDTIPLEHLKDLGDAIGRSLNRAFATLISPTTSGEAESQKKTEAPSPVKPTTASAGG